MFVKEVYNVLIPTCADRGAILKDKKSTFISPQA